jgi:hypothetical protein
MRSALAAIAGAVLAAGITGGGGSAPGQVVLGADFTGGVEVGKPKGTAIAPVPGTITSLHWETNTAGVGAGTYTVAAEVEGVTVCSTQRACAATGSANVECNANVAAGEDVHVTITTSTCDTLPLGMASLWLTLVR